MKSGLRALFVALLVAGFAVGSGEARADSALYEIEASRLGGEKESLSAYRGQVLLIVNTASRCGYTPQYEGLQALYEKRHAQGFSVLGFPSNDFGAQEPGSNQEIAKFCRLQYGVEFPMFAKVAVKGDAAHPLYAYLTSLPKPVGGPVQWNFQKFLVDRSGAVVASYPSSVKPDDPQLLAKIDELLAAPR